MAKIPKNPQTPLEFFKEKMDHINKSFEKLKDFLEGKTTKETESIKRLKNIVGNYSIRNFDCYAQAHSFFSVNNKRNRFYNQFNSTINSWFKNLEEAFSNYKKAQKNQLSTQNRDISTAFVSKKVVPEEEYPSVALERQITECHLHRGSYFIDDDE